MRRFGSMFVLVVVMLAGTALHAPLAGATVDLVPQGCIKRAGTPLDCPESAPFGVAAILGDVAVTPDERAVYVTSRAGGVFHFARDAAGALTYVDCIKDPGSTLACAVNAEGLGGAGLGGPGSIVISPNSADVYVLSETDDAIVHLRRQVSGSLTAGAGCIEDAPLGAGCTQTNPGLDGPFGLAISRDGTSIYVVSVIDGAVAMFARDADGALTSQGCIEDAPLSVGCAVAAEGLGGASDVAITPDGTSVYTTSASDDALARFSRAASGSLSVAGCIEDAPIDAGCGAQVTTLGGPAGIAIAPDGRRVYVTAEGDEAVTTFLRESDGTTRFAACIRDVTSGLTAVDCPASTVGLAGARDIVASEQGDAVYVVGNSTVTAFEASSSSLTMSGCIDDLGAGYQCQQEQQGLSMFNNFGFNRLGLSADGRSLYATSTLDNAVVRFKRELAPSCSASSGNGAAGAAVAVALPCSDPNADTQQIDIVRGPGAGTLSAVDQGARVVTYTPAPGFVGLDSFEYQVTAGGKTSAPAVAIVNVTAGPVVVTGPPGPTGPTGAIVTRERLLALFVNNRLAARRSKVKVPVVATLPGTMLLEIRRGTKRISVLRGRIPASGRATMIYDARKAKPGVYKLLLTVSSADGQVVKDSSGRLTLRK